MTDQTTRPTDPLVMEIRTDEWRGFSKSGGFVVPIQRNDLGHLTQESETEVRSAINLCLGSLSPQTIPCICALGSGGISLRTIELPPAKETAFENLLSLQIEKEWPISPTDLAWGHCRFPRAEGDSTGTEVSASKVAVAAVKRSLFLHYDAIVKVFTTTPLSRPAALSQGGP